MPQARVQRRRGPREGGRGRRAEMGCQSLRGRVVARRRRARALRHHGGPPLVRQRHDHNHKYLPPLHLARCNWNHLHYI